MSIEVLNIHHNNIGLAIAKIDTEVSDNKNIPVDELIKRLKKRTDLTELHGYISYLASLENKGNEPDGQSKIVQFPSKIIAP